MSTAKQAATLAMGKNQHGQGDHINQVVQSVTDATKRLSQISTASSNTNTKTSNRKNRDTVGPWKLGKTLGKGSSGRVRLAKDMETGKLAAVKIVPKKFVKSNRKKQLPYGIEREIIIMKLVSHPNVMGLYEVWENKSELFLVLEYVEGGELFDYLVSKGKLPEREAIHYFSQIIKGVEYCHGFNICHRDLKPENLLLDKKKKLIKIADFGMAALEPSDKMLETSCGSPHYASPEIVMGKKYHGSSSDIWSCGIILFALLTGHLPFNDDNVKKLLLKVQAGRYQMPQSLSPEAKDLISKILIVNPAKRITIKDILKHDLVTKYESKSRSKSNSDLHLLNRMPNITDFQDVSAIDETILRNLQILWHGVDRDILLTNLMKSGYSEEKMFYSLLKKYQEKQQMSHSVGETQGPGFMQKLADSESSLSSAPYTATSKMAESAAAAPKLTQKAQFSMSSLAQNNLKSTRKTKQGFIASSSSSKLFHSQLGSKSSPRCVSRSSSKKSLTPVSPKKRTLQNSSSKRSLYSLQSISKRSINLNDLLQHDDHPPLPNSSSQNTSSKIHSIVEDYDNSASIHEPQIPQIFSKPAFQLNVADNPSSDVLTHSNSKNDEKPNFLRPKSIQPVTPLRDLTNTVTSQNHFKSTLDPRKYQANSIETLLRKVGAQMHPPQPIRRMSTLKKLRNSTDWSTKETNLFEKDENPLKKVKTVDAKAIINSETLTSMNTSTPKAGAKRNLLKLPSSMINTTSTFTDLSKFILTMDNENAHQIDSTKIAANDVQPSDRNDSSSLYDEINVQVNANYDIFEDAPDDTNDSLTTSESPLDQSHPNLKKKAVSIDTLNTTNVLTPATEVRVSLYANQSDKLESMPRETTEEIISKFKLSPIKDLKQKPSSTAENDIVVSRSLLSMFKDLEEEGNEIDDNFEAEKLPSDQINLALNSSRDDHKRVTLLFDDRVAHAEVFTRTSNAVETKNPLVGSSVGHDVGEKIIVEPIKDLPEKTQRPSKLNWPKADKFSVKTNGNEKPTRNNWFTRIFRKLGKHKSENTLAVYEHKTVIPFDDLHIMTITQFGKNGIDCELKRMERRGSSQHVSYNCKFGKGNFDFRVSIKSESKTILRIEKKGKGTCMEDFEQFNRDIATIISIEEKKR